MLELAVATSGDHQKPAVFFDEPDDSRIFIDKGCGSLDIHSSTGWCGYFLERSPAGQHARGRPCVPQDSSLSIGRTQPLQLAEANGYYRPMPPTGLFRRYAEARRRAAWYRDYLDALVQRDVRELASGSAGLLPLP